MAKGKTTKRTAYDKYGNKVVLQTGEFQRKDNQFAYRYTDEQGKRKTIYAPTINALREKRKALESDKSEGLVTSGRAKTLDDAYEEWKKVKRGIRDHTMNNYVWQYETWVKGGFGCRKLRDITSVDVRSFYNSLHEDKGLKYTTIDGLHTVLRQVFQIAVEQRYIKDNPSANAMEDLRKAVRDNTQKHPALSAAEQARLLTFLKDHPDYGHWYNVFAVMVGTGLRVGELTGLTWDDIDFDENRVDVNHTLIYAKDEATGKMEFAINPPKSKAGIRKVYMFDFVREALLAEKARQEAEGIVCASTIGGYNNFVFLNRFCEVQHQGTLNKALRRIIRDANFEAIDKGLVLLPKFSCHNLRSTYCTRLAEAGTPIRLAMESMGHNDIATTSKIYTTVTKDWENREMSSLNGMFEGMFKGA